MAINKVSSKVDLEKLIATLEEHTPDYLAAVRSHVYSAIRNSKPSDLLEIRVWTYTWEKNPETDEFTKKKEELRYTEAPELPINSDWVKLIYKYMRKKTIPDRIMEAGIEQVVEDAVASASKDYFTKEAIPWLSEELARQVDTNKELRAVLLSELKLLQREAKDMLGSHAKNMGAVQLHNAMAHMVATSTGQMLATTLATPAVKMAIAHAVCSAAGHAVIQHLIHLGIKKLGVTVLAAMIFGAGGASLVSFLAFPIIIAFMTYQYYELPSTFAKKMTPEVVRVVEAASPKIYREVADAYKKTALEQLLAKTADEGVEKFRDWCLDS